MSKGNGKGKGKGSSSNCTTADKWQYGDKSDPQAHVEWYMCIACQAWFHLTCAEQHGILDDCDYFTCEKCL